MTNQINKNQILPRALFYIIASLASFFLSKYVKEGFELNVSSIILIFTFFAAIISTTLSWFIFFESKNRNKKFYLKRIKILLFLFVLFSGLFFYLTNHQTIVTDNGNNYLVGTRSYKGDMVLDDSHHKKLLAECEFKPQMAYSNLETIKNLLFIMAILYSILVSSLFCFVIEYSEISIEAN